MAVKLFVRTGGMPPARWWHNYINTIHTGPASQFAQELIKKDLANQGIEFKDNGTWQIDAWLEFKTEQDKDWFLLKWA